MLSLVTAVIKPHMLESVNEALKGAGVAGMTITEVKGFGRQKGQTEAFRGHEFKVNLLRPAELAVPDTVLTLLGPRPFSYPQYVELFGSRTRPAFDELIQRWHEPLWRYVRRVADDGLHTYWTPQVFGHDALTALADDAFEEVPAEDGAGLWPQPVHARLAG